MTSKMTTMGGVFYPTGYAFIMFPDAKNAELVANELETAGFGSEAVMLLNPHTVLREIGRITDDDSTVELPSVGTEGETVNKYIHLARQGHHAVMVRAPDDSDTERVMAVVRKLPFSYAQKYHMLAMEDLA